MVIIENGQGRGSLNCDTSPAYGDATVQAPMPMTPGHTFQHLAITYSGTNPVSAFLLDPVRGVFIGSRITDQRLPQAGEHFLSCSRRSSARASSFGRDMERSAHQQNLKLINVPFSSTTTRGIGDHQPRSSIFTDSCP